MLPLKCASTAQQVCSLLADFYKSSILWFIYFFLYIHATWRNALINQSFFFSFFCMAAWYQARRLSFTVCDWPPLVLIANCKRPLVMTQAGDRGQTCHKRWTVATWDKVSWAPKQSSAKSLFASKRVRLLWSPLPAIRAVALWRPYQTWFVCKTGLPKEQGGP